MDNQVETSLKQVVESKKGKVALNFNPYLGNDSQTEISSLEQITFYHKKIKSERIIGEFLKDKNVKKRRKKRITKDILKYWDKEFKDYMEGVKNELLERTKTIKRKRIKKISHLFIYLFELIVILGVLLSQKLTYMNHAPFISAYMTNFNSMIEDPFYNNILIGLVYLALIATLYLIIIKIYFEETKKIGKNAEIFINDEFNQMNKDYLGQHKKIHSWFNRYLGLSRYKKPYMLTKIYDPKVVLKKLEDYGNFVDIRYTKFRKKYGWYLFTGFILEISVLALTGYLGYSFYLLYLK